MAAQSSNRSRRSKREKGWESTTSNKTEARPNQIHAYPFHRLLSWFFSPFRCQMNGHHPGYWFRECETATETGTITEAEMWQPSSQYYFLIAQEILTAGPSMSCIFPHLPLYQIRPLCICIPESPWKGAEEPRGGSWAGFTEGGYSWTPDWILLKHGHRWAMDSTGTCINKTRTSSTGWHVR